MSAIPHQLDTDDASGLMTDLGFLLVPAVPDRDMSAYLMVALRPHPTLAHYDPESVELWISHEGRGAPLIVDSTTPLPIDAPFDWGPIRIVDRLGVSNEYLTFGGHMSGVRRDGVRIFVFSSPVPILQRGGHSQSWELGSPELAAFFARLRAAVSDRSFEARVSAATPAERYAAFVADFVERYKDHDMLRSMNAQEWAQMHQERDRLMRSDPAAWAAGRSLQAAVAPLTRAFPA